MNKGDVSMRMCIDTGYCTDVSMRCIGPVANVISISRCIEEVFLLVC